ACTGGREGPFPSDLVGHSECAADVGGVVVFHRVVGGGVSGSASAIDSRVVLSDRVPNQHGVAEILNSDSHARVTGNRGTGNARVARVHIDAGRVSGGDAVVDRKIEAARVV